MNQLQIAGIVQKMLAAGGPIAAWLMSKGMDQTDVAIISELALLIIPPLAAMVWDWLCKRNASLAVAASKIDGVTVTVDPTAAADMVAAAKDTSNDVQLRK